MRKKHQEKEVRSAKFVLPGTADDVYIPESSCPECIKTAQLPSPNSCLPEDELRELEAKIDAANKLLLDLALSNERPEEARRKSFEGLVGQIVGVEIDCSIDAVTLPGDTAGGIRVLQGRIHLAGEDFVLLRDNRKETIIPFEKIRLINPENRLADPPNEPQLIDIDPCLRSAITFNFGETVASSPELIQIFFGISMKIYLLLLLNKKIKLMLVDEELNGTVMNVYEESLTIRIRNEIKREIPFHAICYMVVRLPPTGQYPRHTLK
jgi:hypothetical protein